ncbi:trigger factor [Candidatus Parcubacteria bacterium]|nr:trigger factor [Candidatus Parcubacteria bacterium]
MKVEKKDLKKSQVELVVEIPFKDLEKQIPNATEKISKEVKIDGFRNGKVPYEILKQKVGEMAILEEAARSVINKTLGKAIEKNTEGNFIGQPQVDIQKLAPNNPLVYKVVLALIPEVDLNKYKDLKIKKDEIVLDKKEIEKALEELQNMRVKEVLVDKEIKETDKVMVDIEMFLDNVPVEGGQGRGAFVIIGKDYIIPGFDKNLIGAKKGDVKEFSLPYPREHYMKNLAGKRVDFKVSVKDVYERQMPELDDEFAKSLGLKKLDELRENLEKNMKLEKEKGISLKAEKEMLEKIVEKTKFGEIPELLINHEVKTMMAELEHSVSQKGAKFEDYLKSINKTKNQLVLDLLPNALQRVKVSLLIKEIAKEEKIEVSDKEFEKHQDEVKKQYASQSDILKRIESPEYKAYTMNVLTSEKVVNELKEWNIVK